MLSDQRIRQIETEAAQRAMKLSDDDLRKEAVRLHLEFNDAPKGDRRTELGIQDGMFTREMVHRKLTAK